MPDGLSRGLSWAWFPFSAFLCASALLSFPSHGITAWSMSNPEIEVKLAALLKFTPRPGGFLKQILKYGASHNSDRSSLTSRVSGLESQSLGRHMLVVSKMFGDLICQSTGSEVRSGNHPLHPRPLSLSSFSHNIPRGRMHGFRKPWGFQKRNGMWIFFFIWTFLLAPQTWT